MRILKKKSPALQEVDDETPEDEINEELIVRRHRNEKAQELIQRTKAESELIRRHLGVDDRGTCLRHPNQLITGKADAHRFETIHKCIICASEIQAGGVRQHDNANLIKAVHDLQRDDKEWKQKTMLLYGGVNDASFRSNGSLRSIASVDSYGHNLEFFKMDGADRNKSEDEEIDLHVDDEWKKELSIRIGHVRAWDGNMALRSNPLYAKYFRMESVGIPLNAIKQSVELDGHDPRILNLDKNIPLQDQLDNADFTEEEKEILKHLDNNIMDEDHKTPMTIPQTVSVVHQAYLRRKDAYEELDEELNPTPGLKGVIKRRKMQQKKAEAGKLPPIVPEGYVPPETENPDNEKMEEEKREEEEKQKVQGKLASIFKKQPLSPKRETEAKPQEQTATSASPPATSPAVEAGDNPTEVPEMELAPALPPLAEEEQQAQSVVVAPPLHSFEEKKKKPKRRRHLTQLGNVKYQIASGKEELEETKQELAEREIITMSLTTQVQNLQSILQEKDNEIIRLQEELKEYDPEDPMLTLASSTLSDTTFLPVLEEKEEPLFADIDRKDVVKQRMAKLSFSPTSIRWK